MTENQFLAMENNWVNDQQSLLGKKAKNENEKLNAGKKKQFKDFRQQPIANQHVDANKPANGLNQTNQRNQHAYESDFSQQAINFVKKIAFSVN